MGLLCAKATELRKIVRRQTERSDLIASSMGSSETGPAQLLTAGTTPAVEEHHSASDCGRNQAANLDPKTLRGPHAVSRADLLASVCSTSNKSKSSGHRFPEGGSQVNFP